MKYKPFFIGLNGSCSAGLSDLDEIQTVLNGSCNAGLSDLDEIQTVLYKSEWQLQCRFK